jgi:hypothetical protein
LEEIVADSSAKNRFFNFSHELNLQSLNWKVDSYLNSIPKIAPWYFHKILSSSFVEWKYIAISSENFHGIVGISWYNPFQNLNTLAEGGLLLIVAGKIKNSENQSANICWMTQFPKTNVTVEAANLNAETDGVKFQFNQDSVGKTVMSIRCKEWFNLEMCLNPNSFPVTPIHDFNFKPHPLPIQKFTHWIVNNAIPTCLADFKLEFSHHWVSALASGNFGTESYFESDQ